MTPQENISLQQALKDLEAIDHHIAYEKAAGMVQAFRTYVDALVPKNDGAESRPALPESITFHRKAIQEILDKPDCIALRMYPAINDKKTFTMVLVGVDNNGENIVVKPTTADSTAAKTGAPQTMAALSVPPSGSYDEGQKSPPYPKPTNGF